MYSSIQCTILYTINNNNFFIHLTLYVTNDCGLIIFV